VRAIGRAALLLYFIFALVAILAANSVYLSAISFLNGQERSNTTYQNWFYMVMFGTHLGLAVDLLPIVLFGIFSHHQCDDRPNRRAVRSVTCFFSLRWPSWSPACCDAH